MTSINFMGSYSGIDSSMVDQLMAIEKRPLVQLGDRKTLVEKQKNAWNDVRTRVNNLVEKLRALENNDTFQSKIATGGDAMQMTASRNAQEAVYHVSVEQMATRSRVVGGVVQNAGGSSTQALGLQGSFALNGEAHQVHVEETDSLRSIADKINQSAKESGVQASIIDHRLVLTNTETGEKPLALLEIGNSNLLEGLGLGAAQVVEEGKNAKFTINGVEVERESNIITDVVESVTLTLSKTHDAGQYETITIGLDQSKAKKAVEEFVAQYNSTMQFIEDKLRAGEAGVQGSRGDLAGDSTLIRLHSSLRSMVNSTQEGEGGALRSLSQLGVTTQDRHGKLTLNAERFQEALAENAEGVQRFFSHRSAEGETTGLVKQIQGYLNSFVSTTGIIRGKTESFDRTIRDITRQTEAFTLRMQRREQYYLNMFSKLDTAMMQAESQMNWLNSQIAGMTASMVNTRK